MQQQTEDISNTTDEDRQPSGAVRHRLLQGLKVIGGFGLLGYLFWQAKQSDAFEQLLTQPLNGWLLALALLLTLGSVLLGFVRWWLVVLAAGIDFSLASALRVGALGFALNFVGPGNVSGDLYKAVALGRGLPGKRTAALTTIFVDRVLGLFSMLITASLAITALRFAGFSMDEQLWLVGRTISVGVVLGALGLALLFVPGVANERIEEFIRKLPISGGVLGDFIATWATYRESKLLLVGAAALCPAIVVLFVASFYCVALGLPLNAPPFLHHCFIVPVQLTAAALVPTPQGIGAREWVVEVFYRGFGMEEGQGTLIAFGHGLTLLAAGGVATVYYFARRSSDEELKRTNVG